MSSIKKPWSIYSPTKLHYQLMDSMSLAFKQCKQPDIPIIFYIIYIYIYNMYLIINKMFSALYHFSKIRS